MWARAYQVFERQGGVASRSQLEWAGISSSRIDAALRAGRVVALHPGVYALAGVALSARARLTAACMARPSAVVSHQSAAGLWGLIRPLPLVPTLSVGRQCRGGASSSLVVHRVRDLTSDVISNWQGFVCTNPLRTLVDLAAVLDPTALDEAVDLGLQLGLVSPNALQAAAERVRRPGRQGARPLLRSLADRGLIGGPQPSVLESRVARLLHRHQIDVVASEVRLDTEDGRYRIDYLLPLGVGLEVDGYRYHSRSRDLARDCRRANHLLLAGRSALRFTWWDVTHDEKRVVSEVQRALAMAAAAS